MLNLPGKIEGGGGGGGEEKKRRRKKSARCHSGLLVQIYQVAFGPVQTKSVSCLRILLSTLSANADEFTDL